MDELTRRFKFAQTSSENVFTSEIDAQPQRDEDAEDGSTSDKSDVGTIADSDEIRFAEKLQEPRIPFEI